MTLDPDVAAQLDEEVHRLRRPFKQVLNEALRRGLRPADAAAGEREPFRVTPHLGGLQPGIDPGRLNALADELEDGEVIGRIRKDIQESRSRA